MAIDLGIQTFLQRRVPLPIDQLRLVVWVLLCFPLSLILNQIRIKHFRLYFSTVLAFYIQYSVLNFQAYFLWLQIAIVYLMCVYCPRKYVGRYVAYESFVYLSAVHFRRYIEDSGVEVDVTAILMMNTCKFIMFAFCYQDGVRKDEELDYDYQKKLKIQKLPSVTQYVGFIQFLPSCLVGPAFEYKDYENYLYMREEYQKKASTLVPALKQLALALGCAALYVFINMFWKGQGTISQKYVKSSLASQFLYLMLVMYGVRMKYYAIWSLSMVGVKASGLSYQLIQKDGKLVQSFEKIQVSNIYNVELGTSFKVKVDSWNMSVQQFLKRYIYDRLSVDQKGSKPSKSLKNKAQSATVILSAFWHGFYPSYITSFFHWMLVLQVTQQIYRIGKESKRLSNLYEKYAVVRMLCVLVMNFYFAYYGIFFLLFRLNKIWIFSQASMNLPSLVVYVSYYLFVMKKLGAPGRDKKEE